MTPVVLNPDGAARPEHGAAPSGAALFLKAWSQSKERKRLRQGSTRYAGARQRLYPKKHLSIAIEVFKPIVTSRKGA